MKTTLTLLLALTAALALTQTGPRRDTDFSSLRSVDRLIANLEREAERGGFREDSGDPRGKPEKPGLDWLEGYRYYLHERAFPRDRVDWSAWDRAVKHRAAMPPAVWGAGRGGLRVPTGAWQYVGPKNLGTPYRRYYGLPPLTGRINAMAVDPSNGSHLYAGAAGGGVWESNDAGANWNPLTDAWAYLQVSSIAIHPNDPNTLFVGTGDFDAWTGYTNGMWKSTNGGATWTQVVNGAFDGRAIREIAFDPGDPNVMVAIMGRGSAYWGRIMRSTNGGQTWSNVGPSSNRIYNDLAIGAANELGNRIYWCTDNNGGQVFSSLDRGATWNPVSSLVLAAHSSQQIRVAASMTKPLVAYVLEATGTLPGKVWKTVDGGGTWTNVTNDFPHGNASLGATYNWSQRTYDVHMECSTRPDGDGAEDVVYVGLIDLVQSADGGATWKTIGRAYEADSILHNDQHCVTVDPSDPNVVYAGLDGGLNRFVYDPATDEGAWTYLSDALYVTQFYRMAAHPTDPTRLLGGTQDNASPAARGDLANWSNVGGGDGGWCTINPQNPDVQYATSQNLGIYRTISNWQGSRYISPNWGSDRRAFIAPIALDPNNPEWLYAGTNYLWRYDRTTDAWTPRLGGQELASSGSVNCIAIAPSDSGRIVTGATNGEVWTTADAGATWRKINVGSPSLPTASVKYLSLDPANPRDVLVAFGGSGSSRLYRSRDVTAATVVWEQASGSGVTQLPYVPISGLARDPYAPQSRWYAATDVGVFMTTDAGASWTNATGPLGLPNVQVNDLVAVPGQNALYAATWGRGIWKIALVPGRTVRGTVVLSNLTGPLANKTVTVEVRNAGTTTVRESTLAALDGSGTFSVATSLTGTYDVAVKASHWLRKKVASVILNEANGASGLAFSLRNGDVNGDNTVNIADFIALRSAFGTSPGGVGWNPGADLNEDGSVNIADFVVLRANLGQSGDA
ncbi:MAG: hypothetical protein KIS66_16365 [Fimbriimonadaceae bacterium]|nr:hypothetical protein [Fimbriimonadaceae bacterium]